MNFLKKKLKPLASGFSSANLNNETGKKGREKDLEEDLYDEYVVEAPPHPSELLALGVDPSQIDVNDPEKLRELYRKSKEKGQDKHTNSLLLAKQRQKEEIEERKRTGEEWKFFDSLTARVEQAVKDSQKTLEELKDRSAVKQLAEPEYELRLTADEVFSAARAVKQEKGANEWIDFDDDLSSKEHTECQPANNELSESGCFGRETSSNTSSRNHVAEKLLEDFGIDLRSSEQKRADEIRKNLQSEELQQKLPSKQQEFVRTQDESKSNSAPQYRSGQRQSQEVDPFDTSFLTHSDRRPAPTPSVENSEQKFEDPFDTSYVNI